LTQAVFLLLEFKVKARLLFFRDSRKQLEINNEREVSWRHVWAAKISWSERLEIGSTRDTL